MLLRRKYWLWLFVASFGSSLAYTASVPRQDTAWKRYHSPTANFCVSYPSKWTSADAFDGSGIVFSSGPKKHSRPSGEIDITAFSTTSSLTEPPFTLAVDFQTHLDGLKRFARAKDLRVLDQRETDLLGRSALWAKDSYTDPLDRTSWIEEMVLTRRLDVLYRIELECRSDQAARFESVFNQIVASFQPNCN